MTCSCYVVLANSQHRWQQNKPSITPQKLEHYARVVYILSAVCGYAVCIILCFIHPEICSCIRYACFAVFQPMLANWPPLFFPGITSLYTRSSHTPSLQYLFHCINVSLSTAVYSQYNVMKILITLKLSQ